MVLKKLVLRFYPSLKKVQLVFFTFYVGFDHLCDPLTLHSSSSNLGKTHHLIYFVIKSTCKYGEFSFLHVHDCLQEDPRRHLMHARC